MGLFNLNWRGWPGLSWTVAGAVVASAAAMMTSIARRSGEAVEAITPLTLTVAVTAAVLAVAGATAFALNRHRDLALLSFTASMLIVAVLVLSIFGILVLPAVIATIVVLVRRASGREGIAIALVCGPLTAIGVVALLAIWVQPPLVECRQEGVETTSRPWWDTESGGGASSPPGSGKTVSTGWLETPSGQYQYRCEGGRLVEFRRA